MADVKLTFLGTVYPRQEKNEDGDLVNRNYYAGDTVTVRSAVAENLLELESGGRPLFKKYEGNDDEEKAAPAGAPSPAPAAVKK